MPDTRELSYASEEWMPGAMGPIRLRVGPENVVQRRIGLGRVSYLADHDDTKLLGLAVSGRVGRDKVAYATVEIRPTANNRNLIEELDAGLRDGTSPGFIVHEVKVLADGDPGYDRNEMFQFDVTRWEIYEVSSTPIPRNPSVGLLRTATVTAPERPRAARVTAAGPRTTRKAPARPRTTPRRTLDSGLEREGSPPPKRQLAIPLQRDYMKEQHVAITASLASLGGSSTSPQEQEGASPLGQLLTLAASPKVPQLHHKVGDVEMMMSDGRGWCKIPLALAMQPAPVARAAFTTSSPGLVVGEDAGGPVRQVSEDRSVSAILDTVTQITGLQGDALPAELTEDNALASWVAEGAAASYADLSVTDYGDALKPKTARVSTSFSLQLSIQGGVRFEQAVDAHLRRALRKLIVGGILVGSGINNQPTGVTATTGVAVSEYIAADKAKLETFFDAEAMLDGETDARKRWIMASDLYNLARRTSVQPLPTNSDRRVIDRSFVAGETPANSTDLLPDGTGVFGAWADCVLFSWEETLIILDKISTPGLVKVTLQAYVNCHVRPGSFAILRAA